MAKVTDTTNKFFVAVGTNGVDLHLTLMKLGLYGTRISKEDALNLAAWLVALADDNNRFPEILKAVQET